MPCITRPTVVLRSSSLDEAGWRSSTISWSPISLRAQWIRPIPMHRKAIPRVLPSIRLEAPNPAMVSQSSPTWKTK